MRVWCRFFACFVVKSIFTIYETSRSSTIGNVGNLCVKTFQPLLGKWVLGTRCVWLRFLCILSRGICIARLHACKSVTFPITLIMWQSCSKRAVYRIWVEPFTDVKIHSDENYAVLSEPVGSIAFFIPKSPVISYHTDRNGFLSWKLENGANSNKEAGNYSAESTLQKPKIQASRRQIISDIICQILAVWLSYIHVCILCI